MWQSVNIDGSNQIWAAVLVAIRYFAAEIRALVFIVRRWSLESFPSLHESIDRSHGQKIPLTMDGRFQETRSMSTYACTLRYHVVIHNL